MKLLSHVAGSRVVDECYVDSMKRGVTDVYTPCQRQFSHFLVEPDLSCSFFSKNIDGGAEDFVDSEGFGWEFMGEEFLW